jgi:putative transposase
MKSKYGGVTENDNPMIKLHGVAAVMRWFKARCTHMTRKTIETDFAWQSRFHDHVIRDNRALNQIRKYIRQNPGQWHTNDYFSA